MTTRGFAKSKLDCVNKPGFKYVSPDVALPSDQGFYTAGLSYQRGCQPCPPGFTSSAGATTASDCVLKPGYFLASPGVTAQCSPGSYSAGGAVNTRCTPCFTGLTSASAGSIHMSACNVTRPGYEALFVGDTVTGARLCRQKAYCQGGITATSGSRGYTDCANGR